MTIINPNSISGITSFTAEADVMNFYKSNGALGSLQLNGCNFYTPSGISTFNNLVVGGTLTYEDVKNVDSVGIITARGGLNVTANIDTDTLNVSGISTFNDDATFIGATSGRNVFWDKSEDSLEFGDYTYAKFGADEDLTISSQNTLSLINNKTGELRIPSAGNIRLLKRHDGSGAFAGELANFKVDGAVELFNSGSKKFETTSTGINVTGVVVNDGGTFDGDVTFTGASHNGYWEKSNSRFKLSDNGKVVFGDGADIQIFHSGSSNLIRAYNAPFKIQLNNNEESIVCVQGGEVQLYHNNIKTFQTSTNGVQVFGPEGGSATQYFYADEGDDNADQWGLIASHTSSKFSIDNYAAGGWETSLTCEGNGAVKLFYDDNKKLETTNTGVTVTGNVTATGLIKTDTAGEGLHNTATNAYFFSQGSNETRLYHSANAQIKLSFRGSGDVLRGAVSADASGMHILTAGSSEQKGVRCITDGTTELYYSGSKKLETTSAGTLTQGDLVVTDAVYLSNASTISSRLTLNSENTSSWQGTRDLVAFDLIGNGADHRTGTLSIKIKRNPGDSSPTEMMRLDGVNNLTTFYTAATERFRITSGGNIGIGTHDPQSYDNGAESLVVCGPGGNVGQSGITIVSGSDKYGCLYFGDGTGSSSYRGRVEYRHDNDELQFGAAGAHGDLILNQHGDLFLRGDSVCYIVMGSAGDSTQTGANNSMNWIRGNGTNVQYNCAGGFHAWENSGGEKMKLNGANLELTSATQCRLTLGSAGTAGSNDSNWIRGDGNNIMSNCATTGGEHIFEVAGTATARISPSKGLRAENTCKAWVCYKHDGGVSAIHDSFFVSSVTDEGTGTFSIDFEGDMGTEDAIAYQVGSHNQTPMAVGGVAYTPSYGGQNPWWSMEDDWVRINLQRVDHSGNTYVDTEWWNLIAFGDAI